MHSLYKTHDVQFLENLSYGSHICLFYQNKEELIEILVPYFIEGLKNNEYCIWITSEPVHSNQMEITLKESLSKFFEYKKVHPIEVVHFNRWYFKGNKFDFHYGVNKWNDKISKILDQGFNGLRVASNISWLKNGYWNDFRQYERSVYKVVSLHKSIILCMYPLREYNSLEILEIIGDHQFSMTKYNDSWNMCFSSKQINLDKNLMEAEEQHRSLNKNFQDTALKQTKVDQKIKNYKNFLSNVFSSIQDGICIIDTHLNIKFVNPKMEEWYSNKKPLQGKKCYEVFYERTKPCEDCKCTSIIKSGEMCCILNYQKENEGGLVRYFDVYNYPFIDEETHEINGIIKYFRDETKFATTKRKLKESEEKYRRIFDNSPLGIGIANIDGNVIAMNKKMEELTGFNINELNDLGLENVYVDPSKRNEIIDKIREQGVLRDYEVKMKYKDKSSYLALLNVELIEIEGESLLHTTIRDITYQKLAEKKLKESEHKFRSFVESTPVATFLYQDYKCIYANPAAKNLTEYSLEEFYTMKFWDFVHPDYRNIVINIGKALERNEPFKLMNEIKIITKSGIEKWINGTMVLIEYEGDRAALISAIDITEQKKAREELDKLSKLKSELLTRTSHELKTPVMHIKGYVDLLLHKSKVNLNSEELNIIRHIKKGCLRLETLIYDILHKAELDSNGNELNRTEHNLSSLIELSIRELNSFAALRGHSIILNIHDNMKFNFDRDQIHHVINNLITNAIKYTPLNGVIEISSSIDADFVTIAVHDNGIGIIEKEKERLFSHFGKIERFGQGFDIITEGSGLGLYIAKKIIDLHGGEIWVESEGRNKGSTFYFSLPIVKD